MIELSLYSGRLGELYSYFRKDYMAIPFKGSKVQKKNALKEYAKLLAEYHKQEDAKWHKHLQQLLWKLKCWDTAMDIISTRFWWEVYSEDYVNGLKQAAYEAQASVSHLMLDSDYSWSNEKKPIAECVTWVEAQLAR